MGRVSFLGRGLVVETGMSPPHSQQVAWMPVRISEDDERKTGMDLHHQMSRVIFRSFFIFILNSAAF